MNIIRRVSFMMHPRRRRRYVSIVAAMTFLLTYNWYFGRSTLTVGDYWIKIRLGWLGERALPWPTQPQIDYMSKHVNLTFTVETNFIPQPDPDIPVFLATLTINNTGNDVIPEASWHLYGYIFMLVEPVSYPYKQGFYFYSCGLKVFHINGNLYRFQPIGTLFQEIPPKMHFKCVLHISYHQLTKTDSMPRWFVTGDGLTPKIMHNTAGESLEFVSDFTSPVQYQSRAYMHSHPFTTQDRYRMFKKPEVTPEELSVLPTPLSLEMSGKGILKFQPQSYVIVKTPAFDNEIQYLSELTGINIVQSTPARKCIVFTKAKIDLYKEFPKRRTVDIMRYVTSQAYILETIATEDIIRITADTAQGAFYAVQTLASILFLPEADGNSGLMASGLPEFRIVDAPRYSYRGLHIDVARNFLGVDEVLKLIDVISTYKMNKLHLHMSDDEGWRLEIPEIPELTQIGGKRCLDLQEEQCILPQYGSGPFANTSGSGFYTVDNYKEILRYATERHVEVIPEFDMPGHSTAAIKAIQARETRARRKKSHEATFSVVDENDHSVYKSGQNYKLNAMNPCVPSTYRFVETVMRAVKEMHRDIQPLAFYHFGGDEVAEGAWSMSPACAELMENEPGLSTKYDKMRYFINKVAEISTKQGLSIGAWEDALLSHDGEAGVPFPRSAFKNDDMYVYVWKRPDERRTPHRAKLFANYGYKVILAYGSLLYFDHPYEPDPEERGLYWATRKISNFDAWSFSENIINRDDDRNCPKEVPGDHLCYTLHKPENIVGIQAELWTETVRTDEQAEYLLFPRLLSVAERAWHKASWEDSKMAGAMKRDWAIFAGKVGYRELRRLDQFDVKYRISPPGAIMQNGKAIFNTEFPSQDVEYFSQETRSWTLVSRNMPVSSPIWIRARSAGGKRHSREVLFDPQHSASVTSHDGNAFSTVCLLLTFLLTFWTL